MEVGLNAWLTLSSGGRLRSIRGLPHSMEEAEQRLPPQLEL
jgi:hypothetical protein